MEDQIRTGHYKNASEVFRAGLRLLEAQEQEKGLRLDCLRRAASKGLEELNRGEGIAVSADGLDAFLDDCLAEANASLEP